MPSDGCVLQGKCKVISDNRVDMPDFTRHLEDYFCKQTRHQCARFQVYEALGLDAIPALMLPDQYDWARQIIEERRIYPGKQLGAAASSLFTCQ
jgi:hypothetical protein